MARFLRSDPEEIAAEIMNDVDSDDGDMYGEEEKKKITFHITPGLHFPKTVCHQSHENQMTI